MISDPIVEGGGSASWVKSKLLELDINSTIEDCESTLSNIRAAGVIITPTEIQKFRAKQAANSLGFTEEELAATLKILTQFEHRLQR